MKETARSAVVSKARQLVSRGVHRRRSGESAFSRVLGLGAAAVGVLFVAAACQSVVVTSPNPPSGDRCTSSPCSVPVVTHQLPFGIYCWLSVGVSPLYVTRGTVVSWTLQPIGGDAVVFTSGYVKIDDPDHEFINPKLVSPTTYTWTAGNTGSGKELHYSVNAVRIKKGGGDDGSDRQTCSATNPLIVNVKAN